MKVIFADGTCLTTDFPGGNISIQKIQDNTVYIENELRDTTQDWFYWAFCIKGAAGKTYTFDFSGKNRIGYWGPAISFDQKHWAWLDGPHTHTAFTYTFQTDEVYFAHHMLYSPARFFAFAEQNKMAIHTLCKSPKGNNVPYCLLGEGEKNIIVTARHHACEGTGSYVLEGFLAEYLHRPIANTRIFCVPFVDLDGVLSGDQGKARFPHDHNRDYSTTEKPLYPETNAIKNYLDRQGACLCFDFHSPWHLGDGNDKVFIVQNNFKKLEAYQRFGKILENCITDASLKYSSSDDFPPDKDWNQICLPSFANYAAHTSNCRLGFSLETAYFGTNDNRVSQEKLIELGRCFCHATERFITEQT